MANRVCSLSDLENASTWRDVFGVSCRQLGSRLSSDYCLQAARRRPRIGRLSVSLVGFVL